MPQLELLRLFSMTANFVFLVMRTTLRQALCVQRALDSRFQISPGLVRLAETRKGPRSTWNIIELSAFEGIAYISS
jgi:hypothetical protein